MHLTPDALDRLPAGIRRPGYPRAALPIGQAHLGVGAFHRCHQAIYTEDVLEDAFGPWGIVGINLRPPDLAPTLGAQDGLYTHLAREGPQTEMRVVGAIRETLTATADTSPAIARLAVPELRLVTLTVTEKGLCHVPATGLLNEGDPDIDHDLAHPDRPRTVPGVLVAALAARRQSGAGPLTLISCDNVPANGRVLRRVVLDLARARSAALADWIEAQARFPATMVDRIAPAPTSADYAEATERLGFEDRATVVSEPFRQWVIEDAFAGPRPAWERAGAQIVPDVAPFELLKMRVLNGCQSALCYLGALAGVEVMAEVIAEPLFRRFVARLIEEETLPTLTAPDGVDLRAYVATSYRRIANPAIRHTTAQIATDGSQKLPQRLLAPLREQLRAGRSAPCLTLAVAAWMRYVTRHDARGRQLAANDPLGERLAAIGGRAGGDPHALVRRLLDVKDVFAEDLARNEDLSAELSTALAALQGNATRAAVAGWMQA